MSKDKISLQEGVDIIAGEISKLQDRVKALERDSHPAIAFPIDRIEAKLDELLTRNPFPQFKPVPVPDQAEELRRVARAGEFGILPMESTKGLSQESTNTDEARFRTLQESTKEESTKEESTKRETHDFTGHSGL